MSKTCCGYVCKHGKTGSEFGVWCESCGRKGKGKTMDEAERAFDASTPAIVVLDDARKLPSYVSAHATDLAQIAAPFVRSDRPAFAMMVKKNVRYVQSLTGTAYDRTWKTKEGQDSWVNAMEDALILGATLPDMGCIVPFGDVVEFIPDVEAYRFAVTTGSSAPFESLEIEPIYEKDQYKIGRKDGNFSIEFTSITANRGDVIAIAVYGKHKATGKVIGEVYPVDRLIEKARAHSISYRQYLQDVAAFEAAKMEGKVKSYEGREYIERKIPKKDGTTWDKRVYKDEMHNPYEGADRPEMLRKLAGKSFLAPYIKTRNSTAAINELSADDDMGSLLDGAIDAAFEVVPGEPESPAPMAESISELAKGALRKDDEEEESLFGK